MSVPMILKSLGKHTNTEYTFKNRMIGMHMQKLVVWTVGHAAQHQLNKEEERTSVAQL
jgi:hypothetical protein